MGYRSQVRSLIYGETDKMSVFIASQRIKNPKVWEAFNSHIRVYDSEIHVFRSSPDNQPGRYVPGRYVPVPVTVIDLQGDDWKWYEGYDDVQAWESLLGAAVDAGLDYEFARLGEENTDTEYRFSTDNYQDHMLGIQRSITCEIHNMEG